MDCLKADAHTHTHTHTLCRFRCSRTHCSKNCCNCSHMYACTFSSHLLIKVWKREKEKTKNRRPPPLLLAPTSAVISPSKTTSISPFPLLTVQTPAAPPPPQPGSPGCPDKQTLLAMAPRYERTRVKPVCQHLICPTPFILRSK